MMPRGDRTGPIGKGPKTGRAMGYCSGYNKPGYLNRRNRVRARGKHWYSPIFSDMNTMNTPSDIVENIINTGRKRKK